MRMVKVFFVALLIGFFLSSCVSEYTTFGDDVDSKETSNIDIYSNSDFASDTTADSGSKEALEETDDVFEETLKNDETFDETPEDTASKDVEETGNENSVSQPYFDAPEGIISTGDLIVVTNTSFTFGTGYGDGFVTVISIKDKKVINKIKTTQKNPQVIKMEGDKIFVLNTGELEWDAEKSMMVVKSSGGVDVFSLETLKAGSAPDFNIEIPKGSNDDISGAPGSMAIVKQGTVILVGSSTSSQVYKIDVATQSLINGPDNPIKILQSDGGNNTIFVENVKKGKSVALSFNTDELYVIKNSTGEIIPPAVNIGKVNDLEGPLFATVDKEAEVVYALLTLSSGITRINMKTDPPSAEPEVFVAGAMPNAIYYKKGFLYVVNSGENNIQRIKVETGKSDKPFITLPENTNPWDIAFSDDENFIFISGNMSNTIYAADINTGEIVFEIANE